MVQALEKTMHPDDAAAAVWGQVPTAIGVEAGLGREHGVVYYAFPDVDQTTNDPVFGDRWLWVGRAFREPPAAASAVEALDIQLWALQEVKGSYNTWRPVPEGRRRSWTQRKEAAFTLDGQWGLDGQGGSVFHSSLPHSSLQAEAALIRQKLLDESPASQGSACCTQRAP